ncbi:hypothetical protein M408DRAFT_78701 [Serendipita vermifera MAFF 305830]|uniref:Uncharacterized protein n=1 Tax=Serendipita vermifera MAFF 305830 TaxID=933852 RepID=A0A0C3ADK6_SERVB|nr:hypothetical protein M408DRAFT_78701 [Serendipita vermifera MAFF 305830]
MIAFLTPISTSAPHIYLSALPFAPSESILWKTACSPFPKVIKVSEGRMTEWPKPLKGHLRAIIGLVYSPDSRKLVSCSFDKTVRIWDAGTGMPVGEPLKGHIGGATSVACIAYSPDGRRFISGSDDGTVRIWDAGTRMPVGKPLTGHTGGVRRVAWSPNGQSIVSCSGSFDPTIRIRDAATGAPVGELLRGHLKAITSVAYSPNSRYIVSGSQDQTIRFWDAQQISSNGEYFM